MEQINKKFWIKRGVLLAFNMLLLIINIIYVLAWLQERNYGFILGHAIAILCAILAIKHIASNTWSIYYWSRKAK